MKTDIPAHVEKAGKTFFGDCFETLFEKKKQSHDLIFEGTGVSFSSPELTLHAQKSTWVEIDRCLCLNRHKL